MATYTNQEIASFTDEQLQQTIEEFTKSKFEYFPPSTDTYDEVDDLLNRLHAEASKRLKASYDDRKKRIFGV